MKRTDAKVFADLVIICVLSVVDLVAYFIAGSSIFTDMVSVPFIAFIPGYLIVELVPFLYRYDQVERLMISFIISAAIGAFSYFLTLGLISPMTLVTTALGTILVTELLILVVLYHRLNSDIERKQSIWTTKIMGLGSEFRSMGKGKKVLTLASTLIIMAVIVASLGMLTSVTKERYSEFYVLNDHGSAYDLPHNFTVGSQQQTILGVANHEERPIRYFVEIWLVNYTLVDGAVRVKHMYSVASMNVTLDSTDVDINSPWVPQYESLVPLNFTVPGGYYLYFMLFKDSPEPLPSRPFGMTLDYATDPYATWRIVEAVNNQIQYLRLNVNISSP